MLRRTFLQTLPVAAVAAAAPAPADVPVWNPAFDVTPNELISGFITDEGVFRPPFEALPDPGHSVRAVPQAAQPSAAEGGQRSGRRGR